MAYSLRHQLVTVMYLNFDCMYGVESVIGDGRHDGFGWRSEEREVNGAESMEGEWVNIWTS